MVAISEFKMGKGRTAQNGTREEWTRRYLELTVKLPEQVSVEELQNALTQAEYTIDNWLGQEEASQVPDFNTEELMKHDWKGKKQPDGTYAKASLTWGWDFADKFSPEVIRVLESGPLTIDKYEFKLNETGSLVQTSEKKLGRKKSA